MRYLPATILIAWHVTAAIVPPSLAQSLVPPSAPPDVSTFEPAGVRQVQISQREWESVLERLERAEAQLSNGSVQSSSTRSSAEVHPLPSIEAADSSFSYEAPVRPNCALTDESNCPPAAKSAEATLFPVIKLSGFFHADAGLFDQDANSLATLGDIQNGTDFRRARLQAVGKVSEFTNYSIEMDFAQAGRPSFQDVWLEQTNLPLLGNVRIGQYRQPVSMDSLTSIRQLTFLERSLPFQAFDPFRRVGIMAYDTAESELATWQNSFYKTGGLNNAPLGDSRFGSDLGDVGGYSFATRATRLLWYDEPSGGRGLLHLGGNALYSVNTENDHNAGTPFYEARAIPEFFIGDPAGGGAVAAGTPFLADTGRISSDHFLVYGAELAGQYGPVHFQSEYLVTTVSQIRGPQLFYDGAYAQVGYFLTGENRSYNRAFGVLDKVTPFEDFFTLGSAGFGGWGAWEVAGRISYLNLNDPDALPQPEFAANPGFVTNTTLGINWYWNQHTKLQFNWIYSRLDNALADKSYMNIIAARAQVEF